MLPIEKFSKSSRAKSGLQTYCKPCQYSHNKKHREQNLEKRQAQERASRLRNIDANTWNWLKQRSKKKSLPLCSLSEFKAWYANADKHCAYCGMTNDEALEQFKHRLHIDRVDGTSGYVTSNMVMACQRCNLVKNGYLTHEQMQEVAMKYFIPALAKARAE